MKIKSKLLAVALGPAMAAAAAIAPAAPAHAAPGAAVCVVIGGVTLTPGIHLLHNPTAPPTTGTYNFKTTQLVCAGTVTGLGAATSSGNYSDSGGYGSFNGAFSAGPFTTGGTCSGTVAGTLQAVGGPGRIGPVVVATLTGGCTGLTGASSGTGIVVLTFIPDATTMTGLPTDPTVNDAFMQGAAVLAGT